MEFRRFSPEERDAVRAFMESLNHYCLQSNFWWDEGKGIPVDKDGKPLQESSPPRAPDPVPALVPTDDLSAASLHEPSRKR
jgi:hypothetical protein